LVRSSVHAYALRVQRYESLMLDEHPASTRRAAYRDGRQQAATRRFRCCLSVIALAVLLSSPHSAARNESQEFPSGSVPVVPQILKEGITIPEPCPRTAWVEPKRYMVTWNEPAIDGDFMLVVHPTQLFLRTGHNNPNPNYVYWVEHLAEDQYATLVTFLDAYRGQLLQRNRWDHWPGYGLFTLKNPHISPTLPQRMTPGGEASWQAKFDAAVNSNLRRILSELNRGLPSGRALRLDAAINRYPNVVKIAE
jgi:hypothetical protein